MWLRAIFIRNELKTRHSSGLFFTFCDESLSRKVHDFTTQVLDDPRPEIMSVVELNEDTHERCVEDYP